MNSGNAELVPLADLHNYHRNPRRGSVGAIRNSLLVNGQYRPLIVNRGTHTGRPNEVLAGNHTLRALRDLAGEDPTRWGKAAVWFIDVDDDQAARIVAADNRTADLGGYDDRLLAELLSDLPDLDGTGYDPGDLDDLIASLEEAADETSAELDDALAHQQRKTPSLEEQRQVYETGQGLRPVILQYGPARYVWVVEQLTDLLERYDVETNADAVVRLLEEVSGDTAPDDEQEADE